MAKKKKIEKEAEVKDTPIEETAKSKKTKKAEKAEKKSKTEKKSKPPKKETKDRNEFKHAVGTQSAMIDEMLKKGSDLQTMAEKVGSPDGHLKIPHLWPGQKPYQAPRKGSRCEDPGQG